MAYCSFYFIICCVVTACQKNERWIALVNNSLLQFSIEIRLLAHRSIGSIAVGYLLRLSIISLSLIFFMYSKSKCIEFVASSFSCLFVFLLHWNSFFKIERSCNQLPRESSENVWTGIDLLCFYFAKKWKLFVKNVCCGF